MTDFTTHQICDELQLLESRGAGLRELLERAVTLLHESSSRFDWTGIYELDSNGTLRLGPYVGEPTDHVLISVGHGVCGTAVAKNCNMNIPDVSKTANYLACSTATKSELVVLIRRNGRIYAQIDIDSHQLDAFSDEIETQVEKLADRLAEAYHREAEERGCASMAGMT